MTHNPIAESWRQQGTQRKSLDGQSSPQVTAYGGGDLRQPNTLALGAAERAGKFSSRGTATCSRHAILTDEGHCSSCGSACAGIFDGPAGSWGARRQPLRLRSQTWMPGQKLERLGQQRLPRLGPMPGRGPRGMWEGNRVQTVPEDRNPVSPADYVHQLRHLHHL